MNLNLINKQECRLYFYVDADFVQILCVDCRQTWNLQKLGPPQRVLSTRKLEHSISIHFLKDFCAFKNVKRLYLHILPGCHKIKPNKIN